MDASTIISIVAIVISSTALGWNIYRDAIQKPKFRVSIALKTIVQQGKEPIGPHIYVEALNLGPSSNRVGLVFVKPSWFARKFKKRLSAFITPDWSHMAATPSAAKIEIGDTATFVFPFDRKCFLGEDFSRVGVTDGYGRTHWTPRKQLQQVQEKYRAKFADS